MHVLETGAQCTLLVTVSLCVQELARKHNKETAKLYGQMNMAAIDIAEKLDRELNLKSNFQRISHGTWSVAQAVC